MGGDLENAIQAARRAVDLTPDSGTCQTVLARLELLAGNTARGIDHLRLAEKLFARTANPTFIGELTGIYGQQGLDEDAMRLFERLEKIAETRRVPPISRTLAFSGLGDE